MTSLNTTKDTVQRAVEDPVYFRGLFIQILSALLSGGTVSAQCDRKAGETGAEYVSLLNDPRHIESICGGHSESAASIMDLRGMILDALEKSDPVTCGDAFALAAIAEEMAKHPEIYLRVPPDVAAALGIFISRFSAAARWLAPDYTPRRPQPKPSEPARDIGDIHRLRQAGANLDLEELVRIREEEEAKMRADIEHRNRAAAEAEVNENADVPPADEPETVAPREQSVPMTPAIQAAMSKFADIRGTNLQKEDSDGESS